MESTYYAELIRPFWAPPSWLFGPVWTILYVIIVASFTTVFYKAYKKDIPKKTAIPFALNLFFNFAFTPIQFGLQNNLLASLDILFVLGTLVWAIKSIKPQLPWVAYANIPYLAWVIFATVLQLTVTYLNA
ncbi:MAG: tryptophan-rich sensory protein [Candidatus Gracilibacteria bacterium]|nr:tryptophan-rich sensory protein [Candidatus Gracilibacteria bacterium]